MSGMRYFIYMSWATDQIIDWHPNLCWRALFLWKTIWTPSIWSSLSWEISDVNQVSNFTAVAVEQHNATYAGRPAVPWAIDSLGNGLSKPSESLSWGHQNSSAATQEQILLNLSWSCMNREIVNSHNLSNGKFSILVLNLSKGYKVVCFAMCKFSSWGKDFATMDEDLHKWWQRWQRLAAFFLQVCFTSRVPPDSSLARANPRTKGSNQKLWGICGRKVM